MRYVVAYDIADDHRRHRVAKFLESWGRRVQKSVFECELSPEELRELLTHLKRLLAPEEDRCHLYRLCGECLSKRLALGKDLEAEWGEVIVV
jgi:CRISPR-associated protein Cas2